MSDEVIIIFDVFLMEADIYMIYFQSCSFNIWIPLIPA